MYKVLLCSTFLLICSAEHHHPVHEEHTISPYTSHNFVGHNHQSNTLIHEFVGRGSHDDEDHHNGAVLANLAHHSAIHANNFLHIQHTAGTQAAFGVKSTLASAAIGAAQAANAVLAGKQALVSNLKRQLSEAQQRLRSEISLFHQSEATAEAAKETAHQARAQVTTLGAAVAAAQGNARHADKAAEDAANVAALQHSMVNEVKQRVARLLGQLDEALGHLHETEESALQALKAAEIAHSNAAATGAAISSHEDREHHDLPGPRHLH